MNTIFFSDIHGLPSALEKLFEQADLLHADLLVLMGDVLYHGPRNGVPGAYDPNRVATMLNDRKDQILAVRGNCDCDVDQMLLDFPIMSDYAQLAIDGRRFFLTHGHLYHRDYMPSLPKGSVFVQGHTHIPALEELSTGITFLNPGSISLPKGGNLPTFAFHDGKELTLRLLKDGSLYQRQ